MTDNSRLKPVTAASSVAAGLLIFTASALATSAVGVDVDLLAQPENLIALGADNARVFLWSWLAALFYYLLLLPVLVYLDRWLGARSGMVRIWTMAGVGYVTVGQFSWRSTQPYSRR